MLLNVKSPFILKRVFNVLTNYKKLKILNYNKKLQKRLDLTVLDFKKYVQIEIELRLIDNLSDHNNYFVSTYFKDSSLIDVFLMIRN